MLKEDLIWVQEVLGELTKTFPNNKSKANVTLPSSDTDPSVMLIFSFMSGNSWYSFGIIEEDLKLTAAELVSQVKTDLKL